MTRDGARSECSQEMANCAMWADLPEELLVAILLRVTPDDAVSSVPAFARVCRSWAAAASSALFWRAACAAMWADKVYVPPSATALLRDKNDPRSAYRFALQDSKRSHLTLEELTAFNWSFRFKAAAGEHWTDSDPWWQSPPAPQLPAFNSPTTNHRHQQGQRQGAASFSSTSSTTASTSPSLNENGVAARSEHVGGGDGDGNGAAADARNSNGSGSAGAGRAIVVRFGADGTVSGRGQMHIPQQFRWAFVRRACGRADDAPLGSYVRVNQFPAYVVGRHKRNWGFVMQSCWVVLTSFEMPPRGADPLLEDDALGVTVEYQASEAMAYNARVTRFYFNELGELDELDDDDNVGDDDYNEEGVGDEEGERGGGGEDDNDDDDDDESFRQSDEDGVDDEHAELEELEELEALEALAVLDVLLERAESGEDTDGRDMEGERMNAYGPGVREQDLANSNGALSWSDQEELEAAGFELCEDQTELSDVGC
eukprot:CAMPEP_0185832432 /NCGR_PEP_ID=MMETSP1353-20130828/2079_1 /TAXON_ID=1077150 /ORGANISM="Erythrolobus australicus, Strain CCMP3124" /LENGTH=484 /DNA_ID=CAMNT_0028530605 /DNA_START=280 /DNA_END=1731 /DNA_ORIENTATION=+